ncbi:MAG: E3 binding domain-containing protein, partial [Azospirillaceae bacterium]
MARRLAKRHGLDLTSLVGSGPGGSVVKRDIEAALAGGGGPGGAARGSGPARGPRGARGGA